MIVILHEDNNSSGTTENKSKKEHKKFKDTNGPIRIKPYFVDRQQYNGQTKTKKKNNGQAKTKKKKQWSNENEEKKQWSNENEEKKQWSNENEEQKQWSTATIRKREDLFGFGFIVSNATFSNISAISWRPVLVVEEAGVPGENHRPWASNW